MSSLPTSPPLSTSPSLGQPLPSGASNTHSLQQQMPLHATSSAEGSTMMRREVVPRRASAPCDGENMATAVARAEGTRKGRFQIREVRASIAEGVQSSACRAALSLQEDAEHAIAIVQDGKLVPSPLSTPRARTRAQTEGDAIQQTTAVSDGNIQAVANAVAAAAVAAAVSSAPGATTFGSTGGSSPDSATAYPSAAAEPAKRQRGRFKLRDIREVSASASVSTSSSSTSPAGGVFLGPNGQQQQQQQQQQQHQQHQSSTTSVIVTTQQESFPGGAPPPATPDTQAALLLLIEQNRQVLEKIAATAGGGSSALDVSTGSAGAG
ncbi:unnamed protein product, partial [Ectocarpus sp. 12 AP-2014]